MRDGRLYPRGLAIEPTEGCNRRCGFCPLNHLSFPRNHRKYMTPQLAEKIAKNLTFIADGDCPRPKVFFAMSGEPLLNPDFSKVAATFRSVLPYSNFALITNGDLLPKVDLAAIYASVDIIILDAYDEGCAERAEEYGNRKGVTVVNFYRDWAPHGMSPFSDLKRKHQKTMVIMDDLARYSGKVQSRRVHNYGGNSPLYTKPLNLRKICVNPIRELVIKHDGKVTICCMDVGNEFIAGDISKKNGELIWFSPAMASARRLLRRGMRGFSPCSYCNACLPSSFTITRTHKMEWPSSSDFRTIKDHFQTLTDPTKNGRDRTVC